MSDSNPRPPRENLIRARSQIQLRADTNPDTNTDQPVLYGHFARFNEWTEIDSLWEGNFMERLAPGSFKKTFRENRQGMRCLFQHGHDPQVGDKPLGPFTDLREDGEGAYYEVDLLDAPYVRDTILPGLRANLYGVSFRFQVIREDINDEPDPTEGNPRGLPERTIKEVRCSEAGPVTFPAYASATAQARGMSLTDDFIMRCFAQDPGRLRDMFERATHLRPDGANTSEPDEHTDQDKISVGAATTTARTTAPPTTEAAPTGHLANGRRDQTAPKRGNRPPYPGLGRSEDYEPWRL